MPRAAGPAAPLAGVQGTAQAAPHSAPEGKGGTFAIQRDVGGVQGLLLATDVFSEAAEQRLFEASLPSGARGGVVRRGEGAAKTGFLA